jgi:uracil phosphoribosyltransferase
MTKTSASKHKQLHIIHHPVAAHKLGVMRDQKTSSLSFRLIVEELSQFLAYEASRDLVTASKTVETPLEMTTVESVTEQICLVSIMRAGNGMLSGMLRILPFALVGHIGIYRDKFINGTVEYYLRLPKSVEGKRTLLLDPLLATGETANAAIERLKEYGVKQIRFLTLLAAPEGVESVLAKHPDIEIYTLSLERGLNEKGYILPGLGDAGDRLYDTI